MDSIKSTGWDNSSSAYAKLPIQGPVLIPCKHMLAAINDASSISSATAILDVGTGPGTAVALLIDTYGRRIPTQARLIASDFSKGMVDATEARKERNIAAGNDVEGCWERLEIQIMDAQVLSAVASNSISHMMGSLVYFMLPDPKKGLLEAYRALKEGGVFACTSWTMTMEWLQLLVVAAKNVRPNGTYTLEKLMPEQWTTTAGVKGQLEAAGFVKVRAEYVEFDWQVEDPETHAEYMAKSSNMRKMIVGDFSDEELDQCVKEYMKLAKEKNNTFRGVAVLGIGQK